MPVHVARGNLLKADVEALVNTVNTVGVMGKGIALQFKRAFPGNFKDYQAACRRGDVVLGHMYVHQTGNLLDNPKYIINFPTKEHWRAKARIEDVESGLKDLVRVIEELRVGSIAVPPLGCGLGGLDWEQVEPLIVDTLSGIESLEVLLYPPVQTPSAVEMPVRTQRPNLTRVRAAVLGLLARYSSVVGRGATQIEIQKLAYLLERGGQPLELQFSRAFYGPYSRRLQHLLSDLEGHYLSGVGDRTAPVLRSEPLVFNGEYSDELEAAIDEHRLGEAIGQVLGTVTGFNSSYGTELLATVDWLVSTSERPVTSDQILSDIQGWSERKGRVFAREHINAALDRLDSVGLLKA